jgi:hypothetical protein
MQAKSKNQSAGGMMQMLVSQMQCSDVPQASGLGVLRTCHARPGSLCSCSMTKRFMGTTWCHIGHTMQGHALSMNSVSVSCRMLEM